MDAPDSDDEAPCADVRERLLHATPADVFAAIRDPARLARWWGPAGFSNHFTHFDFVPGGDWFYVMQAPDGTEYPNASRFAVIDPDARVIVEHFSGHHFLLTLQMEPHPDGTLLRWTQEFDSADHYAQIADFIAVANEQNLDRLAAELARGR